MQAGERSVGPMDIVVLVTAIGLVVSIATAAVASWSHLVTTYRAFEASSSWMPPAFPAPALAATAIETGLVFHSISIAVLVYLGRPARPAWTGVIVFTIVSYVGNVYAGLDALWMSSEGAGQTLPQWLQIAGVLLLGGAPPLLIGITTHVLLDVANAYRIEVESKLEEAELDETDEAQAVDPAPVRRKARRPARRSRGTAETPPADAIVSLIRLQGPQHWQQVAETIGKSRATVYSAVSSDERLAVDNGEIQLR